MLKSTSKTADDTNVVRITSQRILVVDDEPVVCESIKLMLVYDGHSVEMANSGAEALEKFNPSAFDLVMTDFYMPRMRGDELARLIKERAPEMPVILLTAFPPEIKPEAIDIVLTKPFYFDTLRAGLSKILQKRMAA